MSRSFIYISQKVVQFLAIKWLLSCLKPRSIYLNLITWIYTAKWIIHNPAEQVITYNDPSPDHFKSDNTQVNYLRNQLTIYIQGSEAWQASQGGTY